MKTLTSRGLVLIHKLLMYLSHQTLENKASSLITSGFNKKKEKDMYLPHLVDYYNGTFSCVL